MSVSAHLSPEPERRLWIIHESLRRSEEWADVRLGLLGALAALELVVLRLGAPWSVLLALALVLALVGITWERRLPRFLAAFEAPKGRHGSGDSMLEAEELASYTRSELVLRLDRYLGGGVTATPYFEDIIGQIIARAGSAARKKRLFQAAAVLAGLAQLALLA